MTTRPEFAYVQARLQARHGGLPEPLAWQVLEASRTATHYLALARSGPMAAWVDGLDDASDAHRIERHLRSRWRHHVEEVARWLPPRWQPAVRWFGRLSDLALIDALARGTHASYWLQRDESLMAFAQPASELTGQTLPAAGAAAAARYGGDMTARWLDEWQRLLPDGVTDAALLRRPAEQLLPRLLGAGHARAAARRVDTPVLAAAVSPPPGRRAWPRLPIWRWWRWTSNACAAAWSRGRCSSAGRSRQAADAAPASLPVVRAHDLA